MLIKKQTNKQTMYESGIIKKKKSATINTILGKYVRKANWKK